MRLNFLHDTAGDNSSSRLIGFIVIVVALIYSGLVLYLGKDEIVNASVASGALFITIAGPAMAFLFVQKRSEMKQEYDEKILNKNLPEQFNNNETKQNHDKSY